MIPHATVFLLGTHGRVVSAEVANESGEIVWTGLPLGYLRCRVTVPGFDSLPLAVTIRGGVEQNVEAGLKVGCMECVRPEVETVQMPPLVADLPLGEDLNVFHRKMLSVLGPQGQMVD